MKTKKLLIIAFLIVALLTIGAVNVNAATIIEDELDPNTVTETYRIPFKKIVTGEDAPKQTFEFEAKYTLPVVDVGNIGNNLPISLEGGTNLEMTIVEPLKITISKIDTNGENTYEGIINIQGSASDVEHLKETGFTVKEKNTGAENWTYSTTEYFVSWEQRPGDVEGKWIVYNTADKQNTDTPYSQATPVKEMSFTNVYTKPVVQEEPKQEEPKQEEPEIDNPKTGDNIATYSVFLAVALLGITTLIVVKKKATI